MEKSSALSERTQVTGKADYHQLIRKSMVLACFLFPLLLTIAAIFLLLDDEPRWKGYVHLTWYAGIITMLVIANALSALKPRLAFIAGVFCFVGGISEIIVARVDMEHRILIEQGYDVSWESTIEVVPEIAFFAITIEMLTIGVLMLGVGTLQTGVFPRWTGGLLVAAAIAYFIYHGPGGAISDDFPKISFLVAVVCYTLGVLPIAWQLWKMQDKP